MQAHGSVLLPMQSVGIMLEVLEEVLSFLDRRNLKQVPVYLCRPKAREILASSQIYAEWLHPKRTKNAYKPETPFIHDNYIQSNRLIVLEDVVAFERKEIFGEASIAYAEKFSQIQADDEHKHLGLGNNFKEPCIVIASYPSLRLGDAAKILSLFSNSDKPNSVIFTEADTDIKRALLPFKPTCEVKIIPIDTRLDCERFADVLRTSFRPKHIVTSNYIAHAMEKSGQKLECRFTSSAPGQVHHYAANLESLKKGHVNLTQRLADEIMLVELKDDLKYLNRKPAKSENANWICSFEAVVTKRDGEYTLDSASDKKIVRGCPVVAPDTDKLYSDLKKAGIRPLSIEKEVYEERTINLINIKNGDLKILLVSDEQTKIVLGNTREHTMALKKQVLSVLNNLISV